MPRFVIKDTRGLWRSHFNRLHTVNVRDSVCYNEQSLCRDELCLMDGVCQHLGIFKDLSSQDEKEKNSVFFLLQTLLVAVVR